MARTELKFKVMDQTVYRSMCVIHFAQWTLGLSGGSVYHFCHYYAVRVYIGKRNATVWCLPVCLYVWLIGLYSNQLIREQCLTRPSHASVPHGRCPIHLF